MLASITMAPANGTTKAFYEDEKNLNKLCNFLRSSEGPAVREAVMMDKRVYYIKGRVAFVFSALFYALSVCLNSLLTQNFSSRIDGFPIGLLMKQEKS